MILEWLSLLETGVLFVPDDSTAQSDNQLTEPKTSSLDKTTAAAAQDVQVPENQGEDVVMKNEKIEKQVEVEEEKFVTTKKVQW